jgi:hypothetical protein
MSIGLVIYFAYSYSHSHIGREEDRSGNEIESNYKPPIAAMIAIGLAVALTVWQVSHLVWIEMAVRLFAWIVTGVLVAVLMYGKGDRNAVRSAQTKTIGLALSVINLVIWSGITYWFFMHYAQLHK